MEILDEPLDGLGLEAGQWYSYATFPERVAAKMIDFFIIAIPSVFLPFIFWWLYTAVLESGEGKATLGKRAIGIMVVDTHGKRLDFGRASVRFWANIINVFTCFIGFLYLFFNDRRQCLHDLIAGTMVVRNKPIQQLQTNSQATTRTFVRKGAQNEQIRVVINPKGVFFTHSSELGTTESQYTLEEVVQGMVDFETEFGQLVADDIKDFARNLINRLRQNG